jgi:hypothetical protein
MPGRRRRRRLPHHTLPTLPVELRHAGPRAAMSKTTVGCRALSCSRQFTARSAIRWLELGGSIGG